MKTHSQIEEFAVFLTVAIRVFELHNFPIVRNAPILKFSMFEDF